MIARAIPPPECAEAAPLRRVASLLRDARTRERLLGWADMIDRAPAHRRAAMCEAVAVVKPALSAPLGVYDTLALDALDPRFGLRPEIRARLLLGERPVDIAPGLTRAEARAWVDDCAPKDIPNWLIRRYAPDAATRTQHLAVARWLLARWRSTEQRDALLRPRSAIIAGMLIEGRYIDRVDELRPADLSDSVDDTYRAAAVRLTRELERSLRSHGEPLAPAPKWWVPIRCARLLRTGPDLVAEGRALAHCVASYADAVRTGHSVIVGITVLGARSTVELDPASLSVRQHRGRGNAPPPELCVRALEVCLRRWQRSAVGADPSFALRSDTGAR